MDYLIIIAVTADVLFAAMACGTSGIRIPWYSSLCISAVSSGFLLLTAAGKNVLFDDLPEMHLRFIGFCALMLIGLMEIFGDRISHAIERTASPLLAPLRTGAAVFLDHTRADKDHSKVLSPTEAIVLAVPISIDALLGGFGICAKGAALLPVLAFALVWNDLAVWFGRWFGTKLPIPSEHARSIVCGTALMAIGCSLLL